MAAGNIEKTRKVVKVNDVINKAHFNTFFLAVLLVLICTAIFDGYDTAIWGVLNPILIKNIGMTPAEAGMLASWGFIGVLVGSFFFGILADAIGRKRSLMIAVTMFCCFSGLCGFSKGFGDFAFYRLLAGVGLAGLTPSNGALLSEYSPVRMRSGLITLSTIGMQAGSIVVSLIGLVLVNRYGWRVVFYTSFFLLVILVFQYFLLPESMVKYIERGRTKKIGQILHKADPNFIPSEDDEYQLTKLDNQAKGSVLSLFSLGFAKNTVLFCCILFLNYFVLTGEAIWFPKLMMQLGNSYNVSLWFSIVYSVGAVSCAILASFLVIRFGIKRMIPIYLIIGAVVTASLGFKVSTLLTILLVLIAGGSIQGAQGMLNGYVAPSYPLAVRATAVGTIFTIGRVGSIAGPIILGVVITAGWSTRAVFLILAIPCIINIFLVMLTTDYTKKDGLAEFGVKVLQR